MGKVIHRNDCLKGIVLAGLLAVSSLALADSSDEQAAPASGPGPDAFVSWQARSDDAPGPVRDRLLELVVQYLELGFVREPGESRTASLEPGRDGTTGAQ